MTQQKKATMSQSIFLMLVIVAGIVGAVKMGAGLPVPMMLTWPLIYLFCKLTKLNYQEAETAAFDALRKSLGTIMIVCTVGALVGAWIVSGTIPSLIYYGLKIINPRFFLVCCLLLCSIMSMATGTAYGSAASAGVAMMGIGLSMGVPAGMIAGAVLCGATFGDKMSPLSDTTNLCPALTGGTLFGHIKSMLWTTVPAYLITAVIFTVLGLRYDVSNYNPTLVNDTMAALSQNFHISLISLLPIILVVILLIMKVDTLPAIVLGGAAGLLIGVLYQGIDFGTCVKAMYSGFSIESGNLNVDKLLSRGGITSMDTPFYIMIFAIGMSAMLEQLGVMENLLRPVVKSINSTFKLVASTMFVSYLCGALTAGVAASHVLTGKLMAPLYKEKGIAPEVCSRTMEDCGTIGGIMMPWHSNAVYYTGLLGVTVGQYLPFIFLTYLVPIFALICAGTGIGIYYVNQQGERISKTEHEEIYNSEEAQKI